MVELDAIRTVLNDTHPDNLDMTTYDMVNVDDLIKYRDAFNNASKIKHLQDILKSSLYIARDHQVEEGIFFRTNGDFCKSFGQNINYFSYSSSDDFLSIKVNDKTEEIKGKSKSVGILLSKNVHLRSYFMEELKLKEYFHNTEFQKENPEIIKLIYDLFYIICLCHTPKELSRLEKLAKIPYKYTYYNSTQKYIPENTKDEELMIEVENVIREEFKNISLVENVKIEEKEHIIKLSFGIANVEKLRRLIDIYLLPYINSDRQDSYLIKSRRSYIHDNILKMFNEWYDGKGIKNKPSLDKLTSQTILDAIKYCIMKDLTKKIKNVLGSYDNSRRRYKFKQIGGCVFGIRGGIDEIFNYNIYRTNLRLHMSPSKSLENKKLNESVLEFNKKLLLHVLNDGLDATKATFSIRNLGEAEDDGTYDLFNQSIFDSNIKSEDTIESLILSDDMIECTEKVLLDYAETYLDSLYLIHQIADNIHSNSVTTLKEYNVYKRKSSIDNNDMLKQLRSIKPSFKIEGDTLTCSINTHIIYTTNVSYAIIRASVKRLLHTSLEIYSKQPSLTFRSEQDINDPFSVTEKCTHSEFPIYALYTKDHPDRANTISAQMNNDVNKVVFLIDGSVYHAYDVNIPESSVSKMRKLISFIVKACWNVEMMLSYGARAEIDSNIIRYQFKESKNRFAYIDNLLSYTDYLYNELPENINIGLSPFGEGESMFINVNLTLENLMYNDNHTKM